jgi:NAD+ kinase
MKTLGVIANCTKERAGVVLKALADQAARAGLDLVADPATHALLGAGTVAPTPEIPAAVDAIMALGGDGTMLRVTRELGYPDKPVVGVNIGGLGFMTSVAEEELALAIDCLVRDDFRISRRSVIEAIIERGTDEVGRYRALNEITIKREASSRVVLLDVSVDQEDVTAYLCDGLLVSTPTGSTGHSLSAGGPILMPEANVFVISVICPHTLSSRPLVVPDDVEIVVDTTRNEGELRVAADGQVGQAIAHGDHIHIRQAKSPVQLIRLPGRSYFSVLRQKLGWRGSAMDAARHVAPGDPTS